MKNKYYIIIQIVLIALMYAFGILMFNNLADVIPVHWNFVGEPDNFINKSIVVYLFPLFLVALNVMFYFLPKIDPNKKKYKDFSFAWNVMKLAITVFFAYIYLVSLYAAYDSTVNVSSLVVGGIGVLFMLIGNYMGKIRQNYFIGIKTPWTLSNEEVWNKTHRLGGWVFLISGILFILGALFNQFLLAITIFVVIFILVVPILYSYIIFKRLKK